MRSTNESHAFYVKWGAGFTITTKLIHVKFIYKWFDIRFIRMTLQSHLQYCKTKSSALMYLYFLFLKVFQKTLFSLADFMFNPCRIEKYPKVTSLTGETPAKHPSAAQKCSVGWRLARSRSWGRKKLSFAKLHKNWATGRMEVWSKARCTRRWGQR